MYYNVFRLEQESAFYFNMKYFEEQVQAGEWDDVERYLCGFTKVEGNRYSMKIFFELRKQKYLEALGRQFYNPLFLWHVMFGMACLLIFE